MKQSQVTIKEEESVCCTLKVVIMRGISVLEYYQSCRYIPEVNMLEGFLSLLGSDLVGSVATIRSELMLACFET
jgi:hypothetical protein